MFTHPNTGTEKATRHVQSKYRGYTNTLNTHTHATLPYTLPYVSAVCRACPAVTDINCLLAERVTRRCEPSDNPCWGHTYRLHNNTPLHKIFALHSDYSCSSCLCVPAYVPPPWNKVWFHSALAFSPPLPPTFPSLSASLFHSAVFFCLCAFPLHRDEDRSAWRYGNAGYSCNQQAGRADDRTAPGEGCVLVFMRVLINYLWEGGEREREVEGERE